MWNVPPLRAGLGLTPLQTRVRSAVEMGIDGSIDRVLDNSLVPLQAPILHLFLYCPFQFLPTFALSMVDSNSSYFSNRSLVVHDVIMN
jgi:hypothetical protein